MLAIPASLRLSFRLLSAKDAALLFEVDQDEEVMRYLNGGKRTSMQQITEIFLPRMAQYRNPKRGYGIWQVSRTGDNAYLGWVLIRPMGFNTATPSTDNIELGMQFIKRYRHQDALGEVDAVLYRKNIDENY